MPFRGRHTAETKAKLSAACKGIPRPVEVRKKIAAAKRGKKATKAHRLALRIGHRRTKLFDEERYDAIRARRSEVMKAAWAAGRFANRPSRKAFMGNA